MIGEDGAPFFDKNKPIAYLVSGKTWVNNHAHVLKPLFEVLDPRFLKYYLDQFPFHGFVDGTTRLKLKQSMLDRIPVPLPSIGIQRRIVAEIERQFTIVSAGTEAVSAVRNRIPRLVASAVRFRLGPLWSDSGTSLPQGWRWMEFGETIESLRNGISTKPACEDGQPILKISAVRPMELRLEERRYLNDRADYHTYALQHGDLLFTRYNGNPELVGVCAVVPQISEALLYPDKLIRAGLSLTSILHFSKSP